MKRLDKELLKKNIDEIAEYDFAANKVFGSAYYVYQRDSLSFTGCYGKCSAEGGRDVDGRTVFRLASMTKPVTAFAMLILVDRGFIGLDDSIGDYLPQFKDISISDACGNIKGKPGRLPVIKELLTHCSGLGSDAKKISRMTAEDYSTLDKSIEYLLKTGLDFEPGSQQMYSPTAAFDVAVRIIGTVTKTDYLEFLKKEIFIPCGMYDTTFVPDDDIRARFIDMHCNINGKNAVKKMAADCVFEDVPVTHYLGGGGLVSTLEDYGKFARMLLDRGSTSSGRLIDEETFSLMNKPYFRISDSEWWGLGVRVITGDSHPRLPEGAFGWSGAYGTHFWTDPENEIVAVLMKNSAVDGGAGNESATKLEKAVYSSFENK